MNPVCRIVADASERRSGVVEALCKRGVEVEIDRLPVADYDLAAGILVERKTVADLQVSLGEGRFWRQIGELRDRARLPYLLVEGRNFDAGEVPGCAIRGACLAVIGLGVPIIVSSDPADSALWLHLLVGRGSGERLQRDRPAYAQRLKPRSDQVKEAMLAAVPGISVAGARSLLAAFGSVDGVLSAGYEAWLSVPGIGTGRADALRRAVS